MLQVSQSVPFFGSTGASDIRCDINVNYLQGGLGPVLFPRSSRRRSGRGHEENKPKSLFLQKIAFSPPEGGNLLPTDSEAQLGSPAMQTHLGCQMDGTLDRLVDVPMAVW